MFDLEPQIELQLDRMGKKRISDSDFARLSSFITSNYGIKLPPEKKVMVEGRLQKRLKASNIDNFEDYVDHVLSEQGKFERLDMIDAVSTNKTDFFREPVHFEFLAKEVLPSYAGKPLHVWSAASSSGEEIYTIAMVIAEYNRLSSQKVDYRITGTDISVEILKKAVQAIYDQDRVQNIPLEIKHRYFLKSRKKDSHTVRVVPELRARTQFTRMNLMDSSYSLPSQFDVVFCRNVLIYFDRINQEKVINKLCEKLKPGGYFFLGHSESIFGKNVPLEQIRPTIYKKI